MKNLKTLCAEVLVACSLYGSTVYADTGSGGLRDDKWLTFEFGLNQGREEGYHKGYEAGKLKSLEWVLYGAGMGFCVGALFAGAIANKRNKNSD